MQSRSFWFTHLDEADVSWPRPAKRLLTLCLWSQWLQTGSANHKLLEVKLFFIDQYTHGVDAVHHETWDYKCTPVTGKTWKQQLTVTNRTVRQFVTPLLFEQQVTNHSIESTHRINLSYRCMAVRNTPLSHMPVYTCCSEMFGRDSQTCMYAV